MRCGVCIRCACSTRCSRPRIRSCEPLIAAAGFARENRQPVPTDNPFWQAQERFSSWTETSLDAYRDCAIRCARRPSMPSMARPSCRRWSGSRRRMRSARAGPRKDAAHLALVNRRIEELREGISEGGPREAVIRALLYLRLPDGAFDERGFNLLRRMREEAGSGMSLGEFKRSCASNSSCCSSTGGGPWRQFPACSRKTPRSPRACARCCAD